MDNYRVNIITTEKELNAYEKIKIKDVSDCLSLEHCLSETDNIIVDFENVVCVEVHNPYSVENIDYMNYIIVDKSGVKYLTGSKSFYSSFKQFYDELKNEGISDFKMKIYKKPTKNYQGKFFITCSLV